MRRWVSTRWNSQRFRHLSPSFPWPAHPGPSIPSFRTAAKHKRIIPWWTQQGCSSGPPVTPSGEADPGSRHSLGATDADATAYSFDRLLRSASPDPGAVAWWCWNSVTASPLDPGGPGAVRTRSSAACGGPRPPPARFLRTPSPRSRSQRVPQDPALFRGRSPPCPGLNGDLHLPSPPCRLGASGVPDDEGGGRGGSRPVAPDARPRGSTLTRD